MSQKKKEKGEENKMLTIEALVGSLVIPPNKINKLFYKMFKAGMNNQKLHPDDDSYDDITFKDNLNKIINSLGKSKSKWAKGGESTK